jgi:ribosomal protein L15
MRIPKLRGFKNRFKVEYEVVNVGAIGALAERGAFEAETTGGKSAKAAPVTVNQDILRAVGLVRTLDKPLKILGAGDLSAPLFVVADAFTASARAKIEAAGGSVNVLEIPSTPLAALGVTPATDGAGESTGKPSPKPQAKRSAKADDKDSDKAEDEPEAKTAKATTGKARAAVAPAMEETQPETAPGAAATDDTADEPAAAADDPDADDAPSAATKAETPSGDDA